MVGASNDDVERKVAVRGGGEGVGEGVVGHVRTVEPDDNAARRMLPCVVGTIPDHDDGALRVTDDMERGRAEQDAPDDAAAARADNDGVGLGRRVLERGRCRPGGDRGGDGDLGCGLSYVLECTLEDPPLVVQLRLHDHHRRPDGDAGLQGVQEVKGQGPTLRLGDRPLQGVGAVLRAVQPDDDRSGCVRGHDLVLSLAGGWSVVARHEVTLEVVHAG